MDIELPNDFKEFLKWLNEHEVQYLLIGEEVAKNKKSHKTGFESFTQWFFERKEQ
jgi:hypothetical protein